MAGTKTWVVTSANPRVSHAAVDGETVPVGEWFSNGMLYPGDSAGGPNETANCSCVMDLDVPGRSYDSSSIQKVDKAAEEWKQLLSREEIEAVREYQQHSFELNTALRTGVELTDEQRLLLQLLDDATAKGTISNDTIFYRGINAKKLPFVEGQVVTDRGLVSTTPVDWIAESYASSGQLVEILVPAGTRAGLLGGAFAESGSVGEVLLSRNLRYFVRKVTSDKITLEVF